MPMNNTRACLPCRKAKAKCDLVRPVCGRCTSRGITCSGFPVDVGFIFRNENEVAQRNSKLARSERRNERVLTSFSITSLSQGNPEQQTRATATTADLTLWKHAPRFKETTSDLEPEAANLSQWELYHPHVIDVTNTEPDDSSENSIGEPKWFSLESFKEKVAFTCLFSTCGWANFTRPWLAPVMGKTQTSLISTSARALAIGIVGLEEKHENSMFEAGKLYGTGLGMLADRISLASRRDAAHFIVPVMALTFYTMCVDRTFFTSPRTHYNGLRHIIEYCGPANFEDISLLPAFESARVLLTNEALIRRKRIVFEQRDWKVIPWNLSNKSASTRVFDIIVDIPGILEDLDAMHSSDKLAKQQLRARVVALKSQLSEWRWAWHAENSHVVREVVSNRTPFGIEHPIFQLCSCTMLRFDTITYAGDILLYNSALLWLMRLESILYSTVMEPRTPLDIEWIQTATLHHPNNPLLLPGEAPFFIQPAIEICRSVEDLLPRLTLSRDVSAGVALPIAVASSFIRHDAILIGWLKGILEEFPWSKEPLRWWSRMVEAS